LQALKLNVMTCLNCGKEVQENYCQNCGQRTDTSRITFKSIVVSFVRTFVEADRGFFYNIKNLTIAPQKTIIGYIEGKRAGIYPPLSYAAIMITLFVLMDVNFAITPFEINQEGMERNPGFNVGKEYGKFLRDNLRYLWYLNIFFFAISTYLLFQTYNFAEHVVINAFIFAQAALFAIILYPVLPWPVIANPIGYGTIIPLYILVFRGARDLIDRLVFAPISFILGLFLAMVIPASIFIFVKSLF